MDVFESPNSLKFKMAVHKHVDVPEIKRSLIGQQKRGVFDWLRLFRVLLGVL